MPRRLTFFALLIAAVMIVSAAPTPAFAECSDADKKSLQALDLAWSKAGLSGDKTALMAIYADDYVGQPGMIGKAETIQNTMAAYEENKANPADADKVTYDHYLISCTPVTATMTHRNTIWTKNGTGGKPETFYSRSVHVLEKRNGRWQVVGNASNGLDEYAVLWYLEQDWNDAIMKKDRSWFEKNYATDFTSISSTSGKLMSRAEDIADSADDKSTMELVETTGMNIRIDGNYAIVTGTFRTKGKSEKGAAFDRKIRYTDTWIKRDGRWQAWSSQGTMIPETGSVATN